MNQFVSSIFAVALSVSAFSAISATTPDNTDDGSNIGTSETPQIKQQELRVDKGPIETNTDSTTDDASNLGNSDSPQVVKQNERADKGPTQNSTDYDRTKKTKLMKTKEKNSGTTKGNQIQPNQPESAAPATK
ncbi:MAG: hypothetical protein V4570_03670 [Pseudomonadota bacterium]